MQCKGFTLVELSFTLLISASLMIFAIPSFQQFLQNKDIRNSAERLFSQLQLAKTTAVTSGKNVILCATKQGKTCSKNWSTGSMVFIDNDNNDEFDQHKDQLIDINHPIKTSPQNSASNLNDAQHKVAIYWRSFRGNKPIRFIPMGITWHFNGTFTFCHSQHSHVAKSIFVAKSGRIEMSTDSNGDGRDEGRNGKPIICPN